MSRAIGPHLPPRAVLLTFDDGRISVYRYVFPLLRAYGYPAVIALVGAWMDTPEGGTIAYGDHPLPRDQFVSWSQVSEMQASGLVEVASHSYDLHRGLRATPEGNQIAAALVRQYDPATTSYESVSHYRARLAADMQRAVASIEQGIGHRPRVMVWPYGSFNGPGMDAAREAGMRAILTTEEEAASVEHLDRIGRVTLFRSPGIQDLAASVTIPARTPLLRAIHIPITRLVTGDEAEDERRLGLLLDRLRLLQPSAVIVDGFTQDAQGRWVAHFPTDVLPTAAPRCLRIGWQIRSRIDVDMIIAGVPWRGLVAQLGHDRSKLKALMHDLGWSLPFDGALFVDFSWLAALPAQGPPRPAALPSWPGESSRASTRSRWQGLHQSAASADLHLATAGLTALHAWWPRALFLDRLAVDPAGHWQQQAADANAQRFDYVLMAHPSQFRGGEVSRVMKALQALQHTDDAAAAGRFGVMRTPWTVPADPESAARFFRQLGAAGIRHFGFMPLEWDTPLEQIDRLSREFAARTYPFLP